MTKILLLSVILALMSCAVMEAPQGGPKDETPPRVVGILPTPGSVEVDRRAAINVTFSEKVDGESFKKQIRVFPPAEFEKSGVKGEILEIIFRDELPETTICVVINRGYADYHNVKGNEEIVFYFSTRDSIDTGRITGHVLFKMSPDSTGVAKLIALSSIDSTGKVTTAEESRIAFCGPDGSFAFDALPTDMSMFRIWAFTDGNGDTRYSPGDEFHTVLEDTFFLTGERSSIEGLMINIIDPDEPGRINGTIVDLTELGVAPSARFHPLSEELDPVLVRADTLGNYFVTRIPPGGYIFTAFIDMLVDSLPGEYIDPLDSTRILLEPLAEYPDTVMVNPGDTLRLLPVSIQKE